MTTQKNPLDDILDGAGDALISTVDSAGHAFQQIAAHITHGTSDVLEGASNLIDDITEDTALKSWGDELGEAGREQAEEIDEAAQKLEDDSSPACI